MMAKRCHLNHMPSIKLDLVIARGEDIFFDSPHPSSAKLKYPDGSWDNYLFISIK